VKTPLLVSALVEGLMNWIPLTGMSMLRGELCRYGAIERCRDLENGGSNSRTIGKHSGIYNHILELSPLRQIEQSAH